tara:strand:- start:1477 stop:1995 length:519 start_codon:yes stop_codon:yes gene_type:complete
MSTLKVNTIQEVDGSPHSGFGKIIQVVQAGTASQVTNTNAAAYVDGLTAQITPSSTSSKVLVMFSTFMAIVHTSSGATSGFGGFRVLRDSTAIYTCAGNSTGIHGLGINLAAGDTFHHVAHTQLDTPSSTSQLTYKVQIRPYIANHTMYINGTAFGSAGTDTGLLQLLEVSG